MAPKETTTNTTAAPAAKRGRKAGEPNAPKSFGKVIGGLLDTFESLDPATRKKALAFLITQYPIDE